MEGPEVGSLRSQCGPNNRCTPVARVSASRHIRSRIFRQPPQRYRGPVDPGPTPGRTRCRVSRPSEVGVRCDTPNRDTATLSPCLGVTIAYRLPRRKDISCCQVIFLPPPPPQPPEIQYQLPDAPLQRANHTFKAVPLESNTERRPRFKPSNVTP